MVTRTGEVDVRNPNNGIINRDQIGGGDNFIDIHQESASGVWALGTRMQLGERVFRYTQIGASGIAVAKAVQSQVIEANGDVTDMAVDTPAAGRKVVEVTNGSNTAIAANEFAGGWLHTNDDTGEGHLYQIRYHDAILASAAGNIHLYDKIKVAFVAGTTVSLTHSTYYKNIIHPSPPTALITGVTPVAFTADFYGWIQTWGPAVVLQDLTLNEGQQIIASFQTDGAVESIHQTNDITGHQPLGVTIHPNITAEHALVYLQIAP